MIDPLFAVLVTSIGWGSSSIFKRKAIDTMPPVLAAGLFGLFFGILALFILGGVYVTNDNTLTAGVTDLNSSVKYIFLAAFFTYILGALFFFIALQNGKNTTFTILLAYVLPIIVSIFLAKMVFNDRINNMMALGMAITMVGLVMTVYYKEK